MRSVLVHLRTTTPKALDNYIKDTIFFSSINFYVKQHDHLLDRAFGYMNHTLESSQYLNGIEAKIRFERGGKTFFNRVNFYVKQHNYRLACTTDPNIPNSNSTCPGNEFDTYCTHFWRHINVWYHQTSLSFVHNFRSWLSCPNSGTRPTISNFQRPLKSLDNFRQFCTGYIYVGQILTEMQ